MKKWYFRGQYKADGLGFMSLEQSSSTLSEKKKILICSFKYPYKEIEKNVNSKAAKPYLNSR